MECDPLSEQFSLRWNNFSSNLTTGFLNHLNENDLVDVTLAVEGQLIRAHKLVLSVCSPYFKNIFKETPCQHPVIILKDIKYAEVESLLRFMYQGEINIKQDDLPTFLKVAETLQIKGLTAEGNSSAKSLHTDDDEVHVEADVENITAETVLNTESQETETTERRKRSQDTIKKNVKKKKQETSALSESVHDLSSQESDDNEKQEVLLLSNEDSNDSVDRNESGNASVVRDEDNDEKEESMGLLNMQSIMKNSVQQVVEPVTYRLSARGRPQLVHEGYVYNLTSRSEGLNRSHYRCAEQHRGCRELTVPKKTSTERVRAFRERRRAQKPPKKAPKSALQRLREYRARQSALKREITLKSTMPDADSSKLDNVENAIDVSASNVGYS